MHLTRHSARFLSPGPLRSLVLSLLLLGGLVPCFSARAQAVYVQRNNLELYRSFLLEDGFAFTNPAETRLWEAEYARRFLALTYGEARVNRPFFVDLGIEGSYPIDMPGYADYFGVLQEVIDFDPTDAAVRLEVVTGGRIAPQWRLDADLATRIHLRRDIPAEFYGRFIATHEGFAGLNPFQKGFLFGAQVRPVGLPVGGITLGVFGILSESRSTFTRGTAKVSIWGERDPFSNLVQLELAQALTMARRRLTFRLSGGLDFRAVNRESYEAAFAAEPPRSRYIDLSVEGGMLVMLPLKFRLDLSGRIVPYHSPDEKIVRWYRPVGPELSLALQRKVAVFDLVAGYTLTGVPPRPVFGEVYEDGGGAVVPGSEPGHLFTLTLNVKL